MMMMMTYTQFYVLFFMLAPSGYHLIWFEPCDNSLDAVPDTNPTVSRVFTNCSTVKFSKMLGSASELTATVAVVMQ